MADLTPRPPNGYPLSHYDALRREIRAAQDEIAVCRRVIAANSRSLSGARWMLRSAEHTLAWMLEHQADEIAELEAARARVRAILKARKP